MDELFPKIKRSIENLIEDEDGSVPGNKLLMLGAMVIILGNLLSIDSFAAHRSHSSHKSHVSHSSHVSSSGGGGHGSHESHQSHQSHVSHTSHSNTGAHSNSRFSVEGDVNYAPSASSIPTVAAPVVSQSADSFHLPDINQNIQDPNSTPVSGILPALAVPDPSNAVRMDTGDLKTPSVF